MIIICIINCHSIGRKCTWMISSETLNNTMNGEHGIVQWTYSTCLTATWYQAMWMIIHGTILNKYHRTGPSWYMILQCVCSAMYTTTSTCACAIHKSIQLKICLILYSGAFDVIASCARVYKMCITQIGRLCDLSTYSYKFSMFTFLFCGFEWDSMKRWAIWSVLHFVFYLM